MGKPRPKPVFKTVSLIEPLGIYHETQIAQISKLSFLGFTPSLVTLNGVAQKFQVGKDGELMVLTSLTPRQVLTYTVTQ